MALGPVGSAPQEHGLRWERGPVDEVGCVGGWIIFDEVHEAVAKKPISGIGAAAEGI